MKLGLIGKSLGHSFSKEYFNNKFRKEDLKNYEYQNYELREIGELKGLLSANKDLKGLNVTIPFKTRVMDLLDRIDEDAQQIGAVNTIAIKDGKMTGYNTDHLGFRKSLEPLLKPAQNRALILGTGGASRAISFALEKMSIPSTLVSRLPKRDEWSYEDAGSKLADFRIVINCTPLGTAPHTDQMPPLSLLHVSENHLFYDLIYNPEKTRLLKEAERKGAKIKNGHEMLILQAEAAWQIWHKA